MTAPSLRAEPSLRIMSLHALTYCERLFYLEEVEELYRADEAVHDGRRLHEALADDELASFVLEAPQLGLHGRVDAARKRGGALIPIEVKKGRAAGSGAWPSDRIQVGAYALLLEETQGTSITEGRVRYLESNKTVRVPIDEALRGEVHQAIARARALRLQTTRPPVTANERLCPRCSLAPVCLPEEERRARDAERPTVRLFPPHTDRMVVHVLEHGARVGTKGDRLVVRLPLPEDEVEEQSYPIHQVEAVVVHGNAQMTTQALRLCAEHEVSVQWVTGSGRVFGAMQAVSQSAQRHLRQFRALDREEERLRLSRLLVSAKVDAQYAFLQRGLRGDERPEARELLARVRRGTQQVESAAAIEELLGIEGSTAAAYFEGLGFTLRADLDERLHYVRRSRRPATDRFSALLNYLYGMLHRKVLASTVAVGLHAGLGFYHTPRSAAPPLVLDLMELFRVPMADMPLLAALNRLTFHPDRDFDVSGSHVALSDEGKARLIEIFERRTQEEWRHSVVNYSLSWARIVELEVRLLEKELGGEGRLFAQFRLR